MADGTYDVGLKWLSDNDWVNDDVRVLLLQPGSLTFNRTNQSLTDVLNESGNDEAAGSRKQVAGRTAEIVSGNKVRFDHSNVEYDEMTDSHGAAVYYAEAGSDASRIPIFFKESGFSSLTNQVKFSVSTGPTGLSELVDANV